MSKLAISPYGEITAIWSDDLVSLVQQGNATIERVSDVEPTHYAQWVVKMRDGHVIPRAFAHRSEALAAEVAYLEKQLFSLTDESQMDDSREQSRLSGNQAHNRSYNNG